MAQDTVDPDTVAQDKGLPDELSPARYIDKVSLVTGEVLDVEIEPRHLLISHHRDYHMVEVQSRNFMSRLVDNTGDEEGAREKMRKIRERGFKAAEMIAKATGVKDPAKVSKALFGLKEREYYFRYKKFPATREQIDARYKQLRGEAADLLERARGDDGELKLRVLLTGGTGFVGKEIMWQAAHDDTIAEMVVLIRPKEIRDRKSGELLETHLPQQRGEELLSQLWLDTPEKRSKFRFIAGDVEQPRLGVSEEDYAELQKTLTHVIHCAASVSFDDPYERSFRANVMGTLNALRFSHGLQQEPGAGNPFIAHLGIETSYIHGRQVRKVAREDEVVFPRNFYNNYYELTKAMGSIETERFMLEKGLRVVQLCPAIVIGDSHAGNNRGDTKVVNAPVNVFGRAHEALTDPDGRWFDRTRASMLARMATIFPGNPTAQLNLIPVDWVVQGIIAALKRPQAIGERVHLATDKHVTSENIRDIVREELGVHIKLAEPTLHRTVTLPVLTKLLTSFKQERIAGALDKLGTIFGGYSEWGQPVHEVGNDVRVLGMPDNRPDTVHAFRMLCRHNRYVQDYGRVRDLDEVSRREKVWARFIEELMTRSEQAAGAVSADDFRAAIEQHLDLEAFELKNASPPASAP